jgi:hypothetical protein
MPVPGSDSAWSIGNGVHLQQYSLSRSSFSGALPDLASQVTVEVLLRSKGAKLRGSNPFPPCPGEAGLATFSMPAGKTLQEGFAIKDGTAIRTLYLRPIAAPPDPNVTVAMQNVLCR